MAQMFEPFYVRALKNEDCEVDFSFPPSAVKKTEAQSQLTRQELLALGERVLFVDDEESMVFLMKLWLERLGYKVTGCTRPQEALEIFRAAPQDFDLILSDLSMPEMCGLDFAREVLRIRPGMPVLFTSGYVGPAEEEQVRSIGLPEILPKPATLDELRQTLSEILPKFRLCASAAESAADSKPGRSAAASGG
jgi:CheY-like chemotaxis protein